MSEGFKGLESGGRLLVISPHLDDAVFSCGGLIKLVRDVTVFTVFSGDPPLGQPMLEWDRQCGFEPGTNVMDRRRDEDAQALRMLGAIPLWGAELQEGYRTEPLDDQRLTTLIFETVVHVDPTHVLIPLGLVHHDHKAVSTAAIAALRPSPLAQVILYADKPYAQRHPGAARSRRAALISEGVELRPTAVPRCSRRPNRAAILCYRSQLKGLRLSALRLASYRERYWSLESQAK